MWAEQIFLKLFFISRGEDQEGGPVFTIMYFLSLAMTDVNGSIHTFQSYIFVTKGYVLARCLPKTEMREGKRKVKAQSLKSQNRKTRGTHLLDLDLLT